MDTPSGKVFSVPDQRINKWLGFHCHHQLLGGALLLNLLETSTKKDSERVKGRAREREGGINITQIFREGD